MMQRFSKSIDFVEQQLFDEVSVHEIAAASHYSTYHFSRIFKALVGDTPKEYLRRRRLTVAAKQLLSEDISILDLALHCQRLGFFVNNSDLAIDMIASDRTASPW